MRKLFCIDQKSSTLEDILEDAVKQCSTYYVLYTFVCIWTEEFENKPGMHTHT